MACEGCIYAVGGWYLESLVTPDSNTALYTAVERYDPWDDTWRYASPFFWLVSLSKASFNYLLSYYWLNLISALGLSPHCRSLTSSSPCPCPMMCPLPPASGIVSMCWGASRGLERNCCCSTTQDKVRQNSITLPYLHFTASPNLDLWIMFTVYSLCLLDSWTELLPTLTRADADLPALYFLCATDRLLVIGGNNSENVVTSFCLQSHRWGQVRIQQETKLCW